MLNEEALGDEIVDYDIPTLLDIGILKQSRELKILIYSSTHPFRRSALPSLMLKSPRDHPSQDVHCIDKLLSTFLKEVKTRWKFLGLFRLRPFT